MSGLIPIPDEVAGYVAAIVILGGASGSTIASRIHEKCARLGLPFHGVYCFVLLVLLSLAALLVHLGGLVGTAPVVALAAAAGLAGGFVCYWLDRLLTLKLGSRRLAAAPRRGVSREARFYRAVGGGGRTAAPPSRPGPGWLAATAVLEELIFRGAFVLLAFTLPHEGLRAIALFLSVVAFLLAHLHFGWSQLAAKVPLSVFALGTVLLTGTIVAAIVAHATVNLLVVRSWRQMRPAVAGGDVR